MPGAVESQGLCIVGRMQEDRRYAPPTAALRDDEAERLVSERPAQVRWASVLLWLSFTLGCALSVYELGTQGGDPSEHAPVVDAVVAGITFGALALGALLNVMIYRGHNWARILYLLLTLVSLVLLLVPGEGTELTLTEKIAYAVSSLLDLGAMVLVFTRPGALWFRRKR